MTLNEAIKSLQTIIDLYSTDGDEDVSLYIHDINGSSSTVSDGWMFTAPFLILKDGRKVFCILIDTTEERDSLDNNKPKDS